MRDSLDKIQSDYSDKINSATTLKELDEIFLELFGKNGVLTLFPREFPKLPKDELKIVAPLFNKIKGELDQSVNNKREEVREEGYKKLTDENLDLTPIKTTKQKGHLHPLSQFDIEIIKIFEKMGFQRYEVPDIDSDYNNFEVLNIPPEHPARDLWDTLYIDQKNLPKEEGKLLLRTHTSNSQIRAMKDFKPPIRVMNIGRVFRYENVDARHDHTFEHFELIYIDKGLSMAHLQYLSETFFKEFFGPEIKARLRPKYYPFVEPGAGVDGLCIFCKGKGCKVCGGVGWIELAGAGMIHPQVLKNGGIDPEVYSGIAWGVGRDRMLMIKNQLEDVRLLRNGDLRFLEKF